MKRYRGKVHGWKSFYRNMRKYGAFAERRHDAMVDKVAGMLRASFGVAPEVIREARTKIPHDSTIDIGYNVDAFLASLYPSESSRYFVWNPREDTTYAPQFTLETEQGYQLTIDAAIKIAKIENEPLNLDFTFPLEDKPHG